MGRSSQYGGSDRVLANLSMDDAYIAQSGGGGSRSAAAYSPLSPQTPLIDSVVARDPGAGVTKGDILPDRSRIPHEGDIKLDFIADWDESIAGSAQWQLAQTILSRSSLHSLVSRERELADIQVFNTQISTEGEPVANQLNSGRCWLFAFTNVIRIFTARKYNLGNFQLSQSYLWFYDHVAKSNWFLEQAIDLADVRETRETLQGRGAPTTLQ